MPKPPAARMERKLISSSDKVPSAWLWRFVIAASTVRLRNRTPRPNVTGSPSAWSFIREQVGGARRASRPRFQEESRRARALRCGTLNIFTHAKTKTHTHQSEAPRVFSLSLTRSALTHASFPVRVRLHHARALISATTVVPPLLARARERARRCRCSTLQRTPSRGAAARRHFNCCTLAAAACRSTRIMWPSMLVPAHLHLWASTDHVEGRCTTVQRRARPRARRS